MADIKDHPDHEEISRPVEHKKPSRRNFIRMAAGVTAGAGALALGSAVGGAIIGGKSADQEWNPEASNLANAIDKLYNLGSKNIDDYGLEFANVANELQILSALPAGINSISLEVRDSHGMLPFLYKKSAHGETSVDIMGENDEEDGTMDIANVLKNLEIDRPSFNVVINYDRQHSNDEKDLGKVRRITVSAGINNIFRQDREIFHTYEPPVNKLAQPKTISRYSRSRFKALDEISLAKEIFEYTLMDEETGMREVEQNQVIIPQSGIIIRDGLHSDNLESEYTSYNAPFAQVKL